MDGFQPSKSVLHFHAVRADVLHRRGADRTRNQSEVFQAVPPDIQRVHHPRVPGLARTHHHFHGIAVVGDFLNAADVHVQHAPGPIPVHEYVGTSAEHHQRQLPAIFQRPADIGIAGHFGQALCMRSRSKRRQRAHRRFLLPRGTHRWPRHPARCRVRRCFRPFTVQRLPCVGSQGANRVITLQQFSDPLVARVIGCVMLVHHPFAISNRLPLRDVLRALDDVEVGGAFQLPKLGEIHAHLSPAISEDLRNKAAPGALYF